MRGFLTKWVSLRRIKILLVSLPTLVLFFFLYVWRLGTLTPGLSANEVSARAASSSFNAIKNNPVNLPHKLLQLVLQHLGHHGALPMRGVSVFFALVFLVSFFMLLKLWFGNFIALVGSIFLASTPWIIILARSASTDIMLLCPFLVISSYVAWVRAKKAQKWLFIALMLSVAIAIYTPGIIWFLILGLIIERKKFLRTLKTLPTTPVVLGFTALIILVVPLVLGIYEHHHVAKVLLLIPNKWPSTNEALKSFGWSVLALFFRARTHNDYIVGRLAILSVAQSILTLVGLYAMRKSAKREMLSLLALFLLGIIAASLNGGVYLLTLCLPAAAVFSAAGLRYLHVKWSKVFPLNPLPRYFAVLLISLLVVSQIAYGARYSLDAWPHNAQVRKVYVLK